MLMGLLVKNVILIVEFVFDCCKMGMSIIWVVVLGVGVCFCLILMILLVMVVGLLFLMFVMGVGVNGNCVLGMVVVGGMFIGMIC